ncbi:hypothetical protein MMC30_007325 [Trapelia coarctata]|nr:hypothetical protein [Trapelia coarctata]
MSTQYDKLGTKYDVIKTTPNDFVCLYTTRRILGNVTGLSVLDLACGTGYYTRLFLDWGAASVIGIDISSEMVRVANADLAQTPERADRLEYHVGDVSKPNLLQSLGFSDRKIDLVHGGWLLNYASTSTELVAMWRNIASAIKPGGRFVGLVPNIVDPIFGFDSPFDEGYGVAYEAVAKVDGGYKTRVRTQTDPVVEFENYILNERGLYEKCAREAGMENLIFEPVAPGEELLAEYPAGFWDAYLKRPLGIVCVATRSSTQ